MSTNNHESLLGTDRLETSDSESLEIHSLTDLIWLAKYFVSKLYLTDSSLEGSQMREQSYRMLALVVWKPFP